MDLSIFLARVLGLYMMIIPIAIFLNLKLFKKLLKHFAKNPTAIMMSGVPALMIGLLIINSHNFWYFHWSVLITIIGWCAFLKGITRLCFAEWKSKKLKKMINNDFLIVMGLVVFTIGSFLTVMGFSI